MSIISNLNTKFNTNMSNMDFQTKEASLEGSGEEVTKVK